MAARAIWKAVLRLGTLSVPVKLYSAVDDRKVHLHLLHAKDNVPVKQVLVNSRTGEPLPADEIRKGCDTGEGEIVMLSGEELEALAPAESRDVELTAFLDPALLDERWYDRPYYLGPDGDEDAYFALVRALETEQKEGIARWTMRRKEYVGALRVEKGYLLLVTLRHSSEVVDAGSLPRPRARAPEPQELRMAEQLLGALAADFDPTVYRDEYRARVLELVEAKAKGVAVELRPVREAKAEPSSLTELLRASLDRVGKEKRVA